MLHVFLAFLQQPSLDSVVAKTQLNALEKTKGLILTGQICGSVQFGSLWFTLVTYAVKITTFHFG